MLSVTEELIILAWVILTQYQHVWDGWTDRQTDERTDGKRQLIYHSWCHAVDRTSSTWRAHVWRTVGGVGIRGVGGGASCVMRRGMWDNAHLELGTWTCNLELGTVCRVNTCNYNTVHTQASSYLYPWTSTPRRGTDTVPDRRARNNRRNQNVNSLLCRRAVKI